MTTLHYTRPGSQLRIHRRCLGVATDGPPALQERLGTPELSVFPKKQVTGTVRTSLTGGTNLDAIEYEKFSLLVNHRFIASAYPAASSVGIDRS
jgi:hypothetical protein